MNKEKKQTIVKIVRFGFFLVFAFASSMGGIFLIVLSITKIHISQTMDTIIYSNAYIEDIEVGASRIKEVEQYYKIGHLVSFNTASSATLSNVEREEFYYAKAENIFSEIKAEILSNLSNIKIIPKIEDSILVSTEEVQVKLTELEQANLELINEYRIHGSMIQEKIVNFESKQEETVNGIKVLNRKLNEQYFVKAGNINNFLVLLLYLNAVMVVMIIGIGMLFSKYFSGSVKGMLLSPIGEIKNSSKDIINFLVKNKGISARASEVSRDVAQGAIRQSEKSKEIASLISGIAQSTEKMSNSAGGASESAEHTAKIAKEAEIKSKDSQKSLEDIKNIVLGTLEISQSMSDKSEKINNIVEVITGIAKQTNLLALNASIEAASAGEAGRGFAVVAEEVRKLAEEADKSAGEIRLLVDDLATGIRETVVSAESGTDIVTKSTKEINKTIEGLKSVSDSVSGVTGKVEEVSDIAKEQTKATSDISKIFDSIADVANQNSENANKLLDIVGELNISNSQMSKVSSQVKGMSEILKDLVYKTKKKFTKEQGAGS